MEKAEKTKAGMCEMCGHRFANRQKAHIIAEGKKSGPDPLLLCPSYHIMFNTRVKPKICKLLEEAGISVISG